MLTTTTRQTLTAQIASRTIAELEETVAIARANMLDAWKVQSQTTADEGFSIEQACEATNQALDTEAIYHLYWDELNQRKARALDLLREAEWREAECTCTPLDPMACPVCCKLLDERELEY